MSRHLRLWMLAALLWLPQAQAADTVGQAEPAMQTGLPAIAPQLAKGQPLEGSAIGAGVDLFEDIGDARALSLRDRGILHDDVPIPDPPAAAALTAGLVGG